MSVLVEPTDAKTSFSFEAQGNNKVTCRLFMLVIKSTSNHDLSMALIWRLAKGNLRSKEEAKEADGLSVDFLNLVQEAHGYAQIILDLSFSKDCLEDKEIVAFASS